MDSIEIYLLKINQLNILFNLLIAFLETLQDVLSRSQ